MRRAFVRFALYLVVCWAIVIALAWSATPVLGVVLVAWAIFATVPLVSFLARLGWRRYPTAAFRLLVVRPVLYTQLLLPLTAAAGMIGFAIGAAFGHAVAAGQLAALAILVVASVLLAAGYVGSRWLVTREVDAFIPTLPREFDGLRIAQLSDLHVGPHTPRGFLRRVVATVERMEPDIIAVTGDLVDDRAEDVTPYAEALGRLRAPLGVFMIAGNHDVYAGWEAVERGLAQLVHGTVLVNEAYLVSRGDAVLALVGTGDPAARRAGLDSRAAPDVDRALAGVPHGATVVAFAHNPALWPALAARGVALTLSGHTHWGQFAIPSAGWSLASAFLEHAMGGHREGDSLLYINPGTGYWGIPFRLGALPEVTLVRLRAGTESALRVMQASRS